MKSLSELDSELGLGWYASRSPPCRARARSTEEDFVVEEMISLDLMTTEPKDGYLPVYRVEKRSVDTLHMERELSAALGSRISYGGLKDSRAVAVQYVTPTSARSARPLSVNRRDFAATLVGYLPRPISRGSVLGNKFLITLRDCCAAVRDAAAEVLELAGHRNVPNYFGYQRFGSTGAGTHKIGKAIVRRRFEEAVELLLTVPRRDEGPGALEAREVMRKGDYRQGGELLPPGQDLERVVAARLAVDPKDKIRAIRGIPVEVRRLYVQAYQSYMFNKALSAAVENGLDFSSAERGDNWAMVEGGAVGSRVGGAREPPLPGAAPMIQLPGYAYRDYGSRFDALTTIAMKDEGVGPADFYVKEMQEASAEGGFRIAHLVTGDPRVTTSGDDAVISFSLARGQYATVLLREIIKPEDPRDSGLA